MTAPPSWTAGLSPAAAPALQERALKSLLASTALVLAAASLIAADHALPAAAAARALPLRRTGRFTSLTGAWSGAYCYPYRLKGVHEVPFNARIEEVGEHISGDIDEPNTYADPSAPRLYAFISGVRRGADVSFVKKMDGTGGVSHAINYQGTVDPDLTRIEGRWSVSSGFSGTFFMERAGVEAEAAVERSASATG